MQNCRSQSTFLRVANRSPGYRISNAHCSFVSMGNANGREDSMADGSGGRGYDDESIRRSDGGRGNYAVVMPLPISSMANDSMSHPPPVSPASSRSPLLFASQVPPAPIHQGDGTSVYNQMRHVVSHRVNSPEQQGIPVIITWDYSGIDVAVEGSWDNWFSRKKLQRFGKAHSIAMVLPSGIFHYRFIVDGKQRFAPDLPHMTDGRGNTCNILDVYEYVPEILDSVAEFESPLSPDMSYGQVFPPEEEFAKEPYTVPEQLHVTVFGVDQSSSLKPPRHVVLNHLFREQGCSSQSMVALGFTHRFQSKYVTVVLYKTLQL